MNTIPITVIFPRYIAYTEYEQTEFYCPLCGTRSVFVENVENYDGGPDYACAACGTRFSLPSGAGRALAEEEEQSDSTTAQIIRQLRESVRKERESSDANAQ